MDEKLLQQLTEMRQLFAEVKPTDKQTVEQYAWIICKVLNNEYKELGATKCRQLLADYMKLDVERPSLLHSAVLMAAIWIASEFKDFHFIPFLNMWNLENLRDEDYEKLEDPKKGKFPALAERLAKCYMESILFRPEEQLQETSMAVMQKILDAQGYHRIKPMVVTNIVAMGKDNHKTRLACLVANDGTEARCEIHALKANPNILQPSNKRHYVNIGQVYDVALKNNGGISVIVVDAIQSDKPISESFPVEVGYIDYIDDERGFIHVYDNQSRHFVSFGQRWKLQEHIFVKFVPVVPERNKFKSAMIQSIYSASEGPKAFGLRELIVTCVNQDKHYIGWELADASYPIVEAGIAEPSYTTGYIPFSFFEDNNMNIPSVGDRFSAIVFLKRGKDQKKYPAVVRVMENVE